MNVITKNSKTISLPSLLFISFLLSACGGGGSSSSELPAVDSTGPIVVSTTPETPINGQIIPVTTKITATFNESMNAKSVEDGFIVTPNNNGTIQYDDISKTATYSPAEGIELQGDTDYTITLKNTIKDKADNPLEEITWSFRTEDNIAPTIISTIPDVNSKPISIYDFIRIEFSEPMDLVTFKQKFTDSTRNFEIRTGATTIITGTGIDANGFSGTLTSTGSFVDYKPAVPFTPSTTYTVTINTGIKDKNNNPLDKQLSYTFTTNVITDNFKPKIKTITPTDGSKDNALNSVITVQFVNSDGSPELMDWNTVNSTSFIVENEFNEKIIGIFSNNQTDTLTFTPSSTANPTTQKNLNLLDSYTITLQNTIKDKSGKSLITNSANNQVVSTFYTTDGMLGSIATTLGIGLGSFNNSVPVHLSTKKDGTVNAYWEKNNSNLIDKSIMSRTYQPENNNWDTNPTDITAKIVTSKFLGLYGLSALVTDSNDNHMLIWRDRVDKSIGNFSSHLASEWTKGTGSTGVWKSPKFILQGNNTQSLNNLNDSTFGLDFGSFQKIVNVATVHRSLNGTLSVAWMERDEVALGNGYNNIVLAMRQLKSNNGSFGTTWAAKSRITSLDISPGISGTLEINPTLVSDSVGNIYVLYTKLDKNNLSVAKFPFPSSISNIFSLSSYQKNYFAASSGDNIIFAWIHGAGFPTISNYNVKSDLRPSAGQNIFERVSPNDYYNRDIPFGAAVFSNGKALATAYSLSLISDSKYDPSIGNWNTQLLENSGTALQSFKFHQGSRNIITVTWADNTKLYVKRFKPGNNFGWQPTQSINAQNALRINITSGYDGRTTIVWESFIEDTLNPPRKSDLFAIRLE